MLFVANVGSDVYAFCFFINDPGDNLCMMHCTKRAFIACVKGNNTETPVSSCCPTWYVKPVLVAKALMLPFYLGILCLAYLAFLSCFLS